MLLARVAPRLALRCIRPPQASSRWSCKGFHTIQGKSQRLGNSIGRHLIVSVRFGASQSQRLLQSHRLWALLPVGVGAAGYLAWRHTLEEVMIELDENDIELPPMPEPVEFVHPYESWPRYKKAWFTLKRSAFLAFIFTPLLCTSTFVVLFPDNQRVRERWLESILLCMQRAGAAFQKFGQWLSMRPDMFPPDVIETLAKLRCDSPSHPGAISRQVVRDQLGHEIDILFEKFDLEPVASGSVGQVHRALLRPEFALDGYEGRLRDVAVKVQHPGVADSAFMDLDILWKVVDWSQSVIHMTLPFNRGEFDDVIQAQMDFTREAFNLQKFQKNFKGESGIRFPKVSPKYVTPEVLVETWAEGRVISNILEDFDNAKATCKEKLSSELKLIKLKKRELQGKLSGLLYDMSMKMMVRDNFVHGDLHGGNILYSEGDDHVTVLDAGIATSLSKKSFKPFGSFLHALCSGDTTGIVKYLQIFNESKITVNLPDFTRDIQDTMDKFMGPLRKDPHLPVNAADMFGEVMFTMQRYGMLLKGDVASTLFTISISEGLIRQLDPSFDVARGALPYIVTHMPRVLFNTNGSDSDEDV